MSSIARNSALVTSFAVLGLGLSFLSNLVIAMKFGTSAGMDAYLSKPVRPQELFNAIHRLLPEVPEASLSPLVPGHREK